MKKCLGLTIRLLAVPPVVVLCVVAFCIDWFVQPVKSKKTPLTDGVVGLAFSFGRYVTRILG